MITVWNGYIIGIPTSRSFWAAITNEMAEELVVEFHLDSLKKEDQNLLAEGSFIKWTISFDDSIVELEHSVWSQEEIDAIKERAKDLYDDIF